MKKIIFIALAALMMVGCEEKQPDGTYKPSFYRTYTVDSCEYIGYAKSSQYDFLAHKGNCRFCKERRQKELKELFEQLKEK
jgi:hypothetical protein